METDLGLINYIIVNIDTDSVWLMETDLGLINYIIVNIDKDVEWLMETDLSFNKLHNSQH
jgi:hypothetical protein